MGGSKIIKQAGEADRLKYKLINDVKNNKPEALDDFTAVGIAEGFIEEKASEERVIQAWQHLLDTGLCWKLQGWFGRAANDMIKKGLIKVKANT